MISGAISFCPHPFSRAGDFDRININESLILRKFEYRVHSDFIIKNELFSVFRFTKTRLKSEKGSPLECSMVFLVLMGVRGLAGPIL